MCDTTHSERRNNTTRKDKAMNNPIDALETLTTDNAIENMIIICTNHPEWGTWRLTKDRNGWIKSAPRRSCVIKEGEFRFCKVVINPSKEADRKQQKKINKWSDSLSGRLLNDRDRETKAWREYRMNETLKGTNK